MTKQQITRLHPDIMMTIFLPCNESGTATVAHHEAGTEPLQTISMIEAGLLVLTALVQGHKVEQVDANSSAVVLKVTHKVLVDRAAARAAANGSQS